MMRAAEIHQALRGRWSDVLSQLGVNEQALRDRHGPCPICGGKDRFRYDDRLGRGDYFCNGCGAGDGFSLLQKLHGWSFAEAASRVRGAAGLTSEWSDAPTLTVVRQDAPVVAQPTQRVRDLLRDCCNVADCGPALAYLQSRRLLPLPTGHTLRAHTGAEYWQDGKRAGRFAALVAAVTDRDTALVSLHVTYLTADGRKLSNVEPRKILSALTGRESCAVRLMSHADTLGIAEGIETALSASVLHDVPVWAALNTSLLMKFEPPADVTRLVIFADNDAAGLLAAARLMERLQGRVHLELKAPPAPVKDWNDALFRKEAAT